MRAGKYNSNLVVIPNTLPIEWYADKDNFKVDSGDKIVYAYIGRLDPIKNLELVIQAWKISCSNSTKAELWIIGGGNDEYVIGLKTLVSSLNIDNILFHPFASGEEFAICTIR